MHNPAVPICLKLDSHFVVLVYLLHAHALTKLFAPFGTVCRTEPEDAFSNLHARGVGMDSLGRGHILRSLHGMGEWGQSKAPSWRFGAVNTPKRGGLDSLGRGNILRSSNSDEEFSNYIQNLYLRYLITQKSGRSLDSLGKGNILKRSIRDSSVKPEKSQ